MEGKEETRATGGALIVKKDLINEISICQYDLLNPVYLSIFITTRGTCTESKAVRWRSPVIVSWFT